MSTSAARQPPANHQQANKDFGNLVAHDRRILALATRFSETASRSQDRSKSSRWGPSWPTKVASLFLFAALISINLAVLNALPLPLLDGGQFLLLLIEGLRGQPLPERLQMAFMQSGLVLLLGLSAVLIVKDTSQLSLVRQLMGN